MENFFTYAQIIENPSCLYRFNSSEKLCVECTQCKSTISRTKKSILTTISKTGTKGIACSPACFSRIHGYVTSTKCAFCSKDIEVRRGAVSASGRNYCSSYCSAKVNGLGRQTNPPKKRNCKRCNTEFFNSKAHTNKFHCKACVDSSSVDPEHHKTKTKKEYNEILSVKGKHPSWLNAAVRGFCRSWNASIAKLPCQKCGYALHIELCHIKPVSVFGEETTLGEINHPDNILVLCRNHHWEFDNGHLHAEDIPLREGQISRIVYAASGTNAPIEESDSQDA